ncbi:MAG TPA: cytochrome D1 domain-containing protein [Burkholderiales bacterium]|nr:cytochrome D1 domain-containing protein [Burkholderiales bacterium]
MSSSHVRSSLAFALVLSAPLLWGSPTAMAQGKATAYVSNQEGNITTIDLSTLAPTGEIDIGRSSPRGLGVTADGKLLVVANRDTGDVAIIDRASGKVVKRVPIGKNPEFVRIRDDQAFVSFEPASVGGPPPKPGSAEEKALRQEREEESAQPARIAVIDLKQGQVIREITGGMETEGIEFSGDGKKILVTNEADQNVTVYDIATGKLLKTISTKEYGNRPRGIKIAPNGKYYVVSLEYSNKLVLLDDQFNVIKVVPTGDTPYGLAFSRDGERLFVALSKADALQVFDTRTWQPIRNIPTGQRCWHFSFTPDDSKILVACGRSNEIVVIDAKTFEPIKHIEDKKMPWGIVTYPKSIGSLDAP